MKRIRLFHLRSVVPAAMIVLVGGLAACGNGPGNGQGDAAAMFGGPVPVTVSSVQPESVPLVLEYTGRTQGAREAEVRARVTGILMKRNYTEGQRVKAGQSLFTIDPAPFDAAVKRAEAELAAAEARLDQTQREAARLKPLYEQKAVSQKEYDDAASAASIAAADVQAAQARLNEARLNLEWTRVESPITGVSGRAIPSEGALISGPEVLLTTVTQLDPMRVLFGIPDNEALRLRQEVAAGRLKLPKDNRYKVTLRLADGSEYAQTGVVDFLDVSIDQATGTSEARAELPNPTGALRPGQFVRVRLSGAVREGVYPLPQRAVQEGPQGKFVYVVNAEGKAEPRPIQVAEWTGQSWVVTEGLKPGDPVIVEGTLKLFPGAPVQTGVPPEAAAPAVAK